MPSHEIRDFTLKDFPLLLEKESKAKARSLIRVSNTLVYNNPSHIQVRLPSDMYWGLDSRV